MNARDVIADALLDYAAWGPTPAWPTASGWVVAQIEAHDLVVVACPPGGRVVVSRESKPCEACEGDGINDEPTEAEWWCDDCEACGGSGVVEATTTYGLEPHQEWDQRSNEWTTVYHTVPLPTGGA